MMPNISKADNDMNALMTYIVKIETSLIRFDALEGHESAADNQS